MLHSAVESEPCVTIFPREHSNKGCPPPRRVGEEISKHASTCASELVSRAREPRGGILPNIRRMCARALRVLGCLHLDCARRPVQRTPTLAARTAREHFPSPERADATHACACVPFFLFSSTSSSSSSSSSPPSSSRSAGRRAGAGCKSIAARRWSKRASAEIARWAGLNGGSARVLNTSYLADR